MLSAESCFLLQGGGLIGDSELGSRGGGGGGFSQVRHSNVPWRVVVHEVVCVLQSGLRAPVWYALLCVEC